MHDGPGFRDDDLDEEPMSVIDLLDRMESLVNQSRRVPLTPNVVVNEEELLDSIDHIRVGLPDEVKEARLLLEERDARLREASQQAEQIVVSAQERADRLTDDHEIARRAAADAEHMVTEARERSRRVRREADDYVRDTMEQLEGHLGQTLATVRKGLESLAASRRPDGDGDDPERATRGRRRRPR
ncbi:MAG TPA: hypothetical protein VNN74_01695 [Candidatus Micrarchaeia archaeon]|nr:hypothetical protein [Candidatus Micrarchaeia archaeon]